MSKSASDPASHQPPPLPVPPPAIPPSLAPPPQVTGRGGKGVAPAGVTSGSAHPTATGERDAEEDREEELTWREKLWVRFGLQETPSWLTSLIVHLAIILLLAIVPIAEKIGDSITILSGTSSDTNGEDDLTAFEINPSAEDSEMLENLPDAISLESLNLDLATPALPTDVAANDLALDSPILGGLKGRTGILKETLLKAYGGTQGTEDAVAAGLDWLAKQQRSDGSWSLVGPYKGGATTENKPAATAMAMLAFLGAGNTHQSGEYQFQVKRGLDFLISQQDEDGFFAKRASGNQRTYAQAQCSIAICELYGMTGDPKLESIAMRAIQYAQVAQAKDGGWRYNPKEPGDMSVTGWYVMALMSARMGGLLVDSSTLENVHNFLDLVQRSGRGTAKDPDGERYAYQRYSVGTPAMTAEGMLCRLYLGWSATDKRIQEGCELLCSNPVAQAPDRRSFYYWYYATTSLHHVGGEYWRRWNDVMKVELPALQEKSGPNRGSWSAQDDPHEGGGGRLYSTCFSIYCLETYYRHLPLNRMSGE
ncbi:prenyltransferase/squalene oxidase repeat-containing protein [Pirellulaceae bacterium SH467]